MNTIKNIQLKNIQSDPNQPRKTFDDKDLNELAESIKEFGVLQPILVHKVEKGYMIIAGERRYRASLLAGKKTIPCITKESLTEREILEIQIIENLQRVDVAPIEESEAFVYLVSKGFKHEDIALKVGKSLDFVYKRIKLGNLNSNFKDLLKNEYISLTTATQLSGLDNEDQERVFNMLDIENKSYINNRLNNLLRNEQFDLAEANFDVSKEGMKSNTLSCNNCPFNSKNSFGLFDTQKTICSKSLCFKSKQEEGFIQLVNELKNKNVRIILNHYDLTYLSDIATENLEIVKQNIPILYIIKSFHIYEAPEPVPSKEDFFDTYDEEFIEEAKKDYDDLVEYYKEDLTEFEKNKKDAEKAILLDLKHLKIDKEVYVTFKSDNSEVDESIKESVQIDENEIQIKKIQEREVRKKTIQLNKCFKEVVESCNLEEYKYTEIDKPLSKMEMSTFIFSVFNSLEYYECRDLKNDILPSSNDVISDLKNMSKRKKLDKVFNRMVREFNKSQLYFHESNKLSNSVNYGYYSSLEENFKQYIDSIEKRYKDEEIKREERIKERINKLK